ncbi:MAG: type II toxin-antitoxin system VapC family toxin [Candidatus Marinimicrobia bacterium]|nr:type II toxin-antitoxin system VapC family toxin [Candidatus Neomarinimicrobiota bacterium]MCH8067674.1 type II toxin-antitoxin system VapC family toxin [Candidatus Neomarinimicrobiota bacterium]
MNLLLDTHAFIWFCEGNPRISRLARAAIENLNNTRYLSIASIWEMSLKKSMDKLTLSIPLEQFISKQMEINSIKILPIKLRHVYQVASLPFHHRDPFDRLLVSQCQIEQFSLLSRDKIFSLYNIDVVW